MSTTKKLTTEENTALLETLKKRFEKNPSRHKGIKWSDVEEKLKAAPEKLWTLHQMEESGGEPDVVVLDEGSTEIIFCDCSTESPKGRRSVCYDHEALEARKKFKPANSAMNMAEGMGIEILNTEQYHQLQELGPFDTKTSSWVKTPKDIRELGGALFGDYRFGTVFIYHNGADSYYGARGFRGLVRV
jgi:hypothetical protein